MIGLVRKADAETRDVPFELLGEVAGAGVDTAQTFAGGLGVAPQLGVVEAREVKRSYGANDNGADIARIANGESLFR